MENMKKYRLGIALGGGGAKGFAHLGVLRALEEFGLKPDIIAGCSAGSIVGSFYAAGFAIDDIISLFSKVKLSSFGKVSIPTTGLFSLSKLEASWKASSPTLALRSCPFLIL